MVSPFSFPPLFAEDFEAELETITPDHLPDHASAAAALRAPPRPPPRPLAALPDPETLAAARAEGFAAGRAEGLAEGLAEGRAQGRDECRRAAALECQAALDAALADAARAAAETAAAAAETVADLLLTTLGCLLPELCARHGPAEAAALTRAILPAIAASAPTRLSLRAATATLAGLRDWLDSLDPALTENLRLIAAETMPPGDMVLAWGEGLAAGSARRDVAAAWEAIQAALPFLPSLAEAAPLKAPPHGL